MRQLLFVILLTTRRFVEKCDGRMQLRDLVHIRDTSDRSGDKPDESCDA